MVQFSMGWTPTDRENNLVKHMFKTITEGIMLTNDYWSWEREYEEFLVSGNRLINAVDVAARIYELDVDAAKDWVKDRIVACEHEYIAQKAAFYRDHPDVSLELRRWIEQAGVILAGTHYWASSCPRHHAWKEHRAKVQSLVTEESQIVDLPCIEKPPSSCNASSADTTSIVDSGFEEDIPLDAESPILGKPDRLAGELSSDDQAWRKPDMAPLLAPINYISSLPSQGIRHMLIEAMNSWIGAPVHAVDAISSIARDIHNSSLILDDIEDKSTLRR